MTSSVRAGKEASDLNWTREISNLVDRSDTEARLRRWTLFIAGAAMLAGCKFSGRTSNGIGIDHIPLPPADYEILDWVEESACGSYILFFRIPEQDGEESGGRRRGYVPAGSILGDRHPPDPDSADALYGALVKMPTATHVINPRYTVQSEGFLAGILGRPMIGRRCAQVRVRGVALGNGPHQPPHSAPLASTTEAPKPSATEGTPWID